MQDTLKTFLTSILVGTCIILIGPIVQYQSEQFGFPMPTFAKMDLSFFNLFWLAGFVILLMLRAEAKMKKARGLAIFEAVLLIGIALSLFYLPAPYRTGARQLTFVLMIVYANQVYQLKKKDGLTAR